MSVLLFNAWKHCRMILMPLLITWM